MNRIVNTIDFWLGDFKWYRDLTENDKREWICRHETTPYGSTSSIWERHPKGTFLMYSLISKLKSDTPNFDLLSQKEQREIVQKYINIYYKN
jgi:hypothetical protein